MCHWFETIKIENGVALNLKWHQRRVDATLQAHGIAPVVQLQDFLKLNKLPTEGAYRLRIDYTSTIVGHAITPYNPGTLNTLRIIEDNLISYGYKHTDRTHLDFLKSQRRNCDDVLIVKDNLITDISFANIVFMYGQQYISPMNPLLRGTQINLLAEQGLVHLRDIRLADLQHFNGWIPVNALIGFKPDTLRPISSIQYLCG